MENTKKKKFSIFRILSLILICIFCACTFSSCGAFLPPDKGSTSGGSSGGTSSGGGSSSGSGSSGSLDDLKPPNFGKQENSFSNVNDVIMGAIGVYEVSGSEKVFYDKHSGTFISFNELVDRQFDTLATVLYHGLDYVYGSAGGTGVNLNGFGNTSVDIAFTNLLDKNSILPSSDALNYGNAINGGYTLNVTETNEGVDPDTNEPILTYTYAYDTATVVADNAWKIKIDDVDDLVGALKYIYLNPVSKTTNSTSLDFSDTAMKTAYKDKTLAQLNPGNVELDVIGFNEVYMWNVMYFLGYSVIGDVNMNNSITNHNIVTAEGIDGAYVNTNKDAFQNYKGYHLILKELVNNAFKLTINGLGISAFESDTEGVSLFPKLYREQFVYYDDVEKIQDYQQNYGDSTFDPNKDPVIGDNGLDIEIPSGDDFDEDFEYEEEKVAIEGSNLRKLKRIILIPYTATMFKLESANVNMQTKSGSDVEKFLLKVYWSGIADGTTINDTFVKFSDGSSSIEMTDGEKIEVDAKSETVDTEGRLKVDTVCYDTDNEEITFANDNLKQYGFTSAESGVTGINLEDLVDGAFTSTAEDTSIKYVNIYNRLFNYDIANKTYTININKNLINVDFKYYSEGGDLLSQIPLAYLMLFGLN